jgi:carboxypeptidase Q
MLSAHFDSWDGASGATDNGTGTITMLEAMRILRKAYPRPKRTILVGHWSGEEQGLIGSRAFAADHPEVVRGLQALFNQDNGTGRVVNISGSGLLAASGNYARWLAQLPGEITRHFTNVSFPGNPPGGGSDHASFICHGAPAFGLGALSWDYGTYTWHTNRDTFDKIVFDDLKNNATLVAMLAYLASEDPERVPRDRRVMPANPRTGAPGAWPVCQSPPRSSAGWTR